MTELQSLQIKAKAYFAKDPARRTRLTAWFGRQQLLRVGNLALTPCDSAKRSGGCGASPLPLARLLG